MVGRNRSLQEGEAGRGEEGVTREEISVKVKAVEQIMDAGRFWPNDENNTG